MLCRQKKCSFPRLCLADTPLCLELHHFPLFFCNGWPRTDGSTIRKNRSLAAQLTEAAKQIRTRPTKAPASRFHPVSKSWAKPCLLSPLTHLEREHLHMAMSMSMSMLCCCRYCCACTCAWPGRPGHLEDSPPKMLIAMYASQSKTKKAAVILLVSPFPPSS